MPIYRCLILGENFPVLDDRGRSLIGFYTTRYTEAVDEREAESQALAELRQDDWLQSLKEPVVPEDPEARVVFEEIVEVEGTGSGGSGFTFFPMNENSAD